MKRLVWCLLACLNAMGVTVGCYRHDFAGIAIGVMGLVACSLVASL